MSPAVTHGRLIFIDDETSMTSYALQSERLQIEDAGSEVIVLDVDTNQFHLLNRVAYTILQACNGVTPPREIASALCHTFDLEGRSPDAVQRDVLATLDQLHQKRLIAFIAAGPPNTTTDAAPDSEPVATPAAGSRPLFAVAVEGASMFPALLAGDRVVASTVAPDDLRVGDVIVFHNSTKKRVVHRIVSIEREPEFRLVTKGDAQPRADQPIGVDQVIGKARAVLRGGTVHWISATTPSTASPDRRSTMKGLQVLDLCELSAETIGEIAAVDDAGLVLLSSDNAHAWEGVAATAVKSLVTVPDGFVVYTGQPELVPEMLRFMRTPLRLVVNGQLFLGAFDADQITQGFEALILSGLAYVSSEEAKAALAAVTIGGSIHVLPRDHVRWIGDAVLGPEYQQQHPDTPLVAIGTLTRSTRLRDSETHPPVWQFATRA